MELDWDPVKAVSNLAKHGVAFDAARDLDWERAVVDATFNHPGGEPRLVALAPIGDRLHALVYLIETRAVRIISLRRANNREIDRYEREA